MTQDMLYTAHANDLHKLAYIINNKMMKRERLPEQDSLDGLLVVRAGVRERIVYWYPAQYQ
jgi:hypothetical protein